LLTTFNGKFCILSAMLTCLSVIQCHNSSSRKHEQHLTFNSLLQQLHVTWSNYGNNWQTKFLMVNGHKRYFSTWGETKMPLASGKFKHNKATSERYYGVTEFRQCE